MLVFEFYENSYLRRIIFGVSDCSPPVGKVSSHLLKLVVSV
jgi:hypothetical protein